MAHPLMPKATAVWLVENTVLTFDQIAEFCGLHALEIQAIADDDVAIGMQGMDPIAHGELTQEEIDRCVADSSTHLVMAKQTVKLSNEKKKGARYTPVSKRQDRPDAIAWLLKNYPELTDAQISRLIGTTKPTINSVRERSHWNSPNIKPQNPVGLELCTSANLEKMINISRAKAGTVRAPGPKVAPAPQMQVAPAPAPKPEAAPDANNVFEGTPAQAPREEEAPLTAADVFSTPAKPVEPVEETAPEAATNDTSDT